MPTLFCFGLGYSAQHYIAEFGGRFDRIAGTVTTREKAAAIAARGHRRTQGRGVRVRRHERAAGGHRRADGCGRAAGVGAARRTRDPVLRHFAGTIAGAPQLQSIVYLSTVGVYGYDGGAWVDEATPAAPVSERSRVRLAAEQEWQALDSAPASRSRSWRLSGI